MAQKRYIFVWGNTPERKARKYSTCKVLPHKPDPDKRRRHVVRVRFEADNIEMETSMLALRGYQKFISEQLELFRM